MASKNWLVFVTVLGVFAWGTLSAHGPGPCGGGDRDGEGDRDGFHHHDSGYASYCLVLKFDANGDGVLNEEERAAADAAIQAALLERFDTAPEGGEPDGVLSDEEKATACETLKAEREAAQEAEKAALLEKFDADGDGKLNWEELAAARAAKKAEILEKYDTDKSGDLNEEERAAMMADLCEAKGLPLMGVCVVAPPDGWDGHHHRGGLLGPFGRRLYPCLVIEFDADGDGKLSKEELEAARAAKKAEFLARFDTDGDGKLSKEECDAARETLREEAEARRAAKYAELLAEFDTDGDGKLSEEEMAAARAAKKAEILAEFDVDGDGELNEEERAAARAARCAAEDMDEEDEEGESTMAALVLGLEFLRGDANFDGQVEISDAVGVLGFLFLGQTAPLCLDAADANDTGDIDMSDPLTLLWSLFLGGPALPEPSSSAGEDPTADDLTCEG